jgi:hypothetical protein
MPSDIHTYGIKGTTLRLKDVIRLTGIKPLKSSRKAVIKAVKAAQREKI